ALSLAEKSRDGAGRGGRRAARALSVADPGRERFARREEAARGSARARRYLHLPAAPRRPSRRRSAASRRREDRAERGEVSGRPGARRRAQVHGVRLSGAEGRSSCRAILSDAKTGGPQSGGACPPGLPNRRERSEEHTSELQSRENLVC